jgi:hypothetical protein
MEALKLLCYKNWSIKIECQRYDHDPNPAAYSAIAFVTYIGQENLNDATPAKCFVATLPGMTFHDSHEANLAVQNEAKRQIDELTVQLPAKLGTRQ